MQEVYPNQLQQLLDQGREPVDLERLRNKALQSELQAQRVQIAQLRATILEQNSKKGNTAASQYAGLGIGTVFFRESCNAIMCVFSSYFYFLVTRAVPATQVDKVMYIIDQVCIIR